MQSTVDTFKYWLRDYRHRNRLVQGEATMETLRRFGVVAVVVGLVSLAYTAEFWLHDTGKESAVRASWANALGWAFCMMTLAMLVLGLLAYRLRQRSERSSCHATALQILICTAGLSFAVAITVIDQLVTTNTTPLVLICLLIGMLSLMRPAMALPIFIATYFALFYAVALTQKDAFLLELARSNGRDVVLMSFVVSIIAWRQYVAAVLLRREVQRAHQALADKQAELAFLATHDPLTGLYNRREFMRLADMELARARRYPAQTQLIIADLDHFKAVNDKYGHPVGDAVLAHAAALMKSGVRDTDVIARLGGEEFILLLPNTSAQHARAVAEKLRGLLRATPIEERGILISVTASFGVSGLDHNQMGEMGNLYDAADRALYEAKRGGRDRVEYADPAFAEAEQPYHSPRVNAS